MVYFSLAKDIYATQSDDAVIILDAAKDNYLSLIDDAAHHFKIILSRSFIQRDNGEYVLEGQDCTQEFAQFVNNWIAKFIKQGFIVKTNSPAEKHLYSPAKIPGGLREYQWDTKKNWDTLRHTSYLAALKALITLIRVNRAIKKNGMKGLFGFISKTNKIKKQIKPCQSILKKIIDATDSATKLYPKKTYCLGWAATFVIEARKRGIDCNLMIGIQTNPFYAHAWAELKDGTIIHDDPQVAKVLSVIATIPSDIK